MIKTVSFAPPRGSKTASGSKAASASGSSTRSSSPRRSAPSPAKSAPRASEAVPIASSVPASPFVSPATVGAPTPAVSALDARAALQQEAARKQMATQAVKIRAPRVKKAAIPENLAEQYGAKLSKRVEAGKVDVPEIETPKKRLTKAEREARKQLLRPDEGLLARLQRATPVVSAKRVAKPRGWRFECGRCGRVLHFQTPGALCECGAIAVKD